ncbi:hypothetical protein P1S61_25590 [Streptomyces sp. ME08-AFT2]|nr:hypothetical protein [Streptomyces sp. ME08-AFT2]MDX3312388.1 hypothetical protein [Streptomyces sp. ME08-AFT2]
MGGGLAVATAPVRRCRRGHAARPPPPAPALPTAARGPPLRLVVVADDAGLVVSAGLVGIVTLVAMPGLAAIAVIAVIAAIAVTAAIAAFAVIVIAAAVMLGRVGERFRFVLLRLVRVLRIRA